jgi:hypothetical protein
VNARLLPKKMENGQNALHYAEYLKHMMYKSADRGNMKRYLPSPLSNPFSSAQTGQSKDI